MNNVQEHNNMETNINNEAADVLGIRTFSFYCDIYSIILILLI